MAQTKEKHIVLVGLMGAGKTSMGRQLAQQLDMPFVDTDLEIEYAAGLRISDIFEIYGEDAFRTLEEKVIARVLKSPETSVIATGGGAYVSEKTRRNIKKHGTSIWLKASLNILMDRIVTTVHRPVLQKGNRRQILADLIDARYPLYAEADITVVVEKTGAGEMARKAWRALKSYRREQ